MTRSDLERIRDARDHAHHARRLVSDRDAGELDRVARQAVLYDLVVIGETVNQIAPDLRGLAPHISWRQIVNMRNSIVHAYWQIDWEIILNVVAEELSAFLEAMDLFETAIGPDR